MPKLIRPSGGLSATDKQIVRDNMLETASICNGKVIGTLPVQKTYVIEIPMFSTTPVEIPHGYYGQKITLVPKYVTGTKFVDFSGTGYFGAAKHVAWCNSGTMGVQAASASNGSVYFSLSNKPEQGGPEASYSGQSALCFTTPFAHDYDYCVIEASSTGSCSPAARFVTSVYDTIRYDDVPSLASRTPYAKSTPYLQLAANIGGAPAWINVSGTVTFKSITFYKNAT